MKFLDKVYDGVFKGDGQYPHSGTTTKFAGSLISTGRYSIEPWKVWETLNELKAFVMYNGSDAAAYVGMVVTVTSDENPANNGVYKINKVGKNAWTTHEVNSELGEKEIISGYDYCLSEDKVNDNDNTIKSPEITENRVSDYFDTDSISRIIDSKTIETIISDSVGTLIDVDFINFDDSDFNDSDSDYVDVGKLKLTYLIFDKETGEQTTKVIMKDIDAEIAQAFIENIECKNKTEYKATVTVGNIKSGDIIDKDITIENLIKKILYKEEWNKTHDVPTITNLSLRGKIGTSSNSVDLGSYYEIGTSIIDITATATVDGNTYGTYSDTTKSTVGAGSEFDKDNITLDKDSLTISLGGNAIKGSMSYSASDGDILVTSNTGTTQKASKLGITFSKGTAEKTNTICGGYKIWYGYLTKNYFSIDVNKTDEQIIEGLTSNEATNKGIKYWTKALNEMDETGFDLISKINVSDNSFYVYCPSDFRVVGTSSSPNDTVLSVYVQPTNSMIKQHKLPDNTTINYKLYGVTSDGSFKDIKLLKSN